MKLTRKLEIGINAVNVLKTKTGPTKVADMTTDVGTTVNFLEQIMRNLREAGIVSVKRGPGGGYILNKEAPVTAMQVARALKSEPVASDSAIDQSPVGRLNQALKLAFLNTSI